MYALLRSCPVDNQMSSAAANRTSTGKVIVSSWPSIQLPICLNTSFSAERGTANSDSRKRTRRGDTNTSYESLVYSRADNVDPVILLMRGCLLYTSPSP